MDNKILLLGGGGHCKVILDSLLKINQYTEIGIVDPYIKKGDKILGVSVVGCDEDLSDLYDAGYREAFISLGSIGNTRVRKNIYKMLKELRFNVVTIIDPSADVSQFANIEEGSYIGKNALINAGASIAACSIINTGAIVEHDCYIGMFTHVAPGAVVCGNVKLGENVHVGAASVIKNGIVIGDDVMIGAGSAIVNHIDCNMIAYGNHMSVLKEKSDE